MGKILIRKKKGYLEDFNSDKIKSSLLKAGCSSNEVEKIVEKIKKWAESQPGKIINSFEIEKQIIEHTKDKHKDVLISFLFFAKNKIKPIKRIFNRKDIAQMLTSLFVIIQVYIYDLAEIPFIKGIPILVTSLLTCMMILYLIESKQMWKHLISGFVLVSLLSVIIGVILGVNMTYIIIAISVGLPVAAMVDVLGSRE